MQLHVIFLVEFVKLILKLYKNEKSKKSRVTFEEEPGGKICYARNQEVF